MINILLDYFVVVFIVEVLGIYSVRVLIYMYEFSYRFKVNMEDDWMGVKYGDNILYDFGVLFLNIILLIFIEED